MGRLLSSRVATPAPRKIQSLRSGGAVQAPAPETTRPAAPAPEENNSLRKMGFYAGVAMIFIRMSVLSEVLIYLLGANTYLLYLVGPPALLGAAFSGGFGRVFRSKAAWWWTGLFLWMVLAIPMSSWPGGSFQTVSSYGRTSFICLFVLAGTVVAWKDIELIFKMIAGAGFMVLVVIRFLARPDAEGRLSFGDFDSTIGNSNDLAAHVVLILPFILYFGFRRGQNMIVRVLAVAAAGYSVWVIFGTSSRGAMIGLAAMTLFFFLKGSVRHRVALIAGIPVAVAGALLILPSQNITRLATLFSSSEKIEGAGDTAAEALQSSEIRQYLFKKSVEYSFQHPIFGVGPGQFSSVEGFASRAIGEHGSWHETHNSYTQISSECGLPAFLFMVASLGGAFRIVQQTLSKARARGKTQLVGPCLCYLAAMTGYLVTIIFLACGYRFTLPSLVGIAIAIRIAAERELATAS